MQQEKKSDTKISVFGLGKLGCTMLACFAHKGWQVTGVDVNENTVKAVNSGKSPIYEPGVQELLAANSSRIQATMDAAEAIQNTDITFVIVPTPSLPDGSFSIKYVEVAAAEIGSLLRHKKKYHNVVITSTVLPGDMENITRFMERTSGKSRTRDFGVCYNPDFIALGNVIANFLNPDMVLIGESDDKAGSMLQAIHEALVDNQPRVHRMNFYNAELAKIALNSYCTLKITFANQLAEICEKMPGGDVDVITNAIGDDARIGRKYLKGGLSYGGPCFPRDNRAFARTALKFMCKAPLAELTDSMNHTQRSSRIPDLIYRLMQAKNHRELAVLGLTYKNDTQLVEESAAIHIIRTLAKLDFKIRVYDPGGLKEGKRELGQEPNVHFASSVSECLHGLSICFVATPWKEFTELTTDDFLNQMNDPVIVDGWNLFSFAGDNRLTYIPIGKEIPAAQLKDGTDIQS